MIKEDDPGRPKLEEWAMRLLESIDMSLDKDVGVTRSAMGVEGGMTTALQGRHHLVPLSETGAGTDIDTGADLDHRTPGMTDIEVRRLRTTWTTRCRCLAELLVMCLMFR